MTGPRSEPPMPILTTLRMRLPVWPFHAPLRTRSANSAILSSTAWTSGTTFLPSTMMTAPSGARSATCSTARFSVMLIFSPREHRVDAPAQTRFLGQLQQQLERLVGHAVLGVIEVNSGGLERHPLAARGIVGEQLAQMHAATAVVRRERFPGGPAP